MFCFSFISAARTCETECLNKFKMGVASLAGLAVGLSRAGAHRDHFACLPSWVHNYRMFINTRLDFPRLECLGSWGHAYSWDKRSSQT